MSQRFKGLGLGSIYGTALGSPTPPPRGWSWFPAPPPVGVGGVVVDGWECWLMESKSLQMMLNPMVFARNST